MMDEVMDEMDMDDAAIVADMQRNPANMVDELDIELTHSFDTGR